MDPEVQKALDDMRWEIGLTEVPMKRKSLKKLATVIYRAANKLHGRLCSWLVCWSTGIGASKTSSTTSLNR